MIKILVIEDEPAVLENILELLNAEGFEVIGGDNGASGMKLALESKPHLILCDVMMPELDGYGVLNGLRQNPLTAAIPFIFLTARATKEDMRQGMNLGADDYLTKPFTRDELLTAIQSRLQRQVARNKYLEIALQEAAERDDLTNLPNQRFLRNQLHEILVQAQSEQHMVSLLCLGLNRFNRINDSLGFAFADLLLQAIAERLKGYVGTKDLLARINGAQFALVLGSINHKQQVDNFAQKILASLSQPFIVNEQKIFLTASIGIAFYPNDTCEADNLIQQAESTMYNAKKEGKNNYHFYTPKNSQFSSVPLSLETDLRYALEREELEVYYQPQVNLKTNQIIGSEALLRWRHTEKGMISPAEFIPLAEEIGLIVPIGEWVLRQACQQTKIWHSAGFSSLQVSVNCSGYQLKQENICQKIADIVTEVGLEPRYLELELTESVLVQNPSRVKAIFRKLRELGIDISIDDFGTGYSSLGYLHEFYFDNLKIDRCFISNIINDSKTAAITTAIIEMAHCLNLKVTAEGVETEAQKAFLVDQGCDVMQGYLCSPPVPVDKFEKLLKLNYVLSN